MTFINLNGEILEAQRAVFTTENRSFRYGDGLFETIRMCSGKLPFLSEHLARLWQGMEVLGFEIPSYFDLEFFKQEILKVATHNSRIRLTVFRSEGGLYTPLNQQPQFLIEATPLTTTWFGMEKPVSVSVYREAALHYSPLSSLKTTSALIYVLAGLHRRRLQTDDCLLMNTQGRIAEALSANIFVIDQQDVLQTPSLQEGCIAGVMRRKVLELARRMEWKTAETTLSIEQVAAAREVWLTNSISGIRTVSYFKDTATNYREAVRAQQMTGLLNGEIKKGR